MLVLPNADDIRHLQRDLTVLNELPGGAYFTARSDVSGVDTISRCFFPSQGINEDPATGSAHLAIARYWSPLLAKRELVCFQPSARGGTLQLRVDGSRVTLAGNAVPISRGELLVV